MEFIGETKLKKVKKPCRMMVEPPRSRTENSSELSSRKQCGKPPGSQAQYDKIRYPCPGHRYEKWFLPPDPSLDSPGIAYSDLYDEWGGEFAVELPGEYNPLPMELLRRWIRKQRFIPQDLTDTFLELFLIWAYYDWEKAAQRLQQFFYTRQEFVLLYRGLDPLSPENHRVSEILYVLPLPASTERGWKVILTGLLDNDPYKYNLVDHIKAIAFAIDLLIWDNSVGFGDLVVLLDCRGFQCPHMLQQPIYEHKSIQEAIQNSIPCRLRGVYLLFPPDHIEAVTMTYNGIWVDVFLNEVELSEKVPAELLPEEFGGSLGKIFELFEEWNKKVMEYRDFFVGFEMMIANDFRRRMCYLKELQEGGRAWIFRMKLVSEETDFKKRYHEKLEEGFQIKHEGFGKLRVLPSDYQLYPGGSDPLSKIKETARKETEALALYKEYKLDRLVGKEIECLRAWRKAQGIQEECICRPERLKCFIGPYKPPKKNKKVKKRRDPCAAV